MSDTRLAVLERLHVLVESIRGQSPNQMRTMTAARSVTAAIENARPPFAIQFTDQSVRMDGVVLPLEGEGLARALQLGDLVRGRGAEEVRFEAQPPVIQVLELAHELTRPGWDNGGLTALQLSHIRFRARPDPESLAPASDGPAEEIERALTAARDVCRVLGSDGTWHFGLGSGVVRLLDRVEEFDPRFTSRALEARRSPSLDSAGRALLAAHHASTICRVIGMTPLTHRAVAHAALLVAAVGLGLGDRGGLTFHEAAQASRSTVARSLPSADPVPHTVQVATLIRDVADDQPLETASLVKLAYQLERRRAPASSDRNLTLVQVFADALAEERDPLVHRWLKLRLLVAGPLLPVSKVRASSSRGK